MKTYKVKTKFIFEGYFEVKADSVDEAEEIVDNDCGLVLGGDIHTQNDEQVIDWNFPCHPHKVMIAKKMKE